jgi:hypothetical protein
MSEILNTDDDILSFMFVGKSDLLHYSQQEIIFSIMLVQLLMNKKNYEWEPLVGVSDEAISSDSESELDESIVVVGGKSNMNGSRDSE